MSNVNVDFTSETLVHYCSIDLCLDMWASRIHLGVFFLKLAIYHLISRFRETGYITDTKS